MIRFLRRHKLTCLVLFILFYMILGATAPFLSYKRIEDITAENFARKKFRMEGTGPERVALLETNESAWTERMRLLEQAEERIILSTFDMREGESTRDILAVLLAKAEEGVDIRILVDGVSGAVRMEGHELFYALSSHPNVEIRIYNPLNLLTPWKLMGRMHDKYVIVDEKAYLLGGRNTFDYFIGNYTNENVSYDREVLVYNTRPGDPDTSLRELEAYFEGVWNLEVCKPFHNSEKLEEKKKVQEERKALEERYAKLTAENPELFEGAWDYAEHTYEAGKISLLSNPTHIYGKEPVLFYELVQLMKQADERVIFQTPYVVCNSWMYEELTELKEAVPDTRILLNAVENGDNFVASSDYLRHKDKVVATGIQLYEYDGGTSNHGKSILIDNDLSIVGSYNLDLRSTYLDTELMLVVQSEGLNQELEEYMTAMEQDSRKIIDAKTFEAPEHLEIQEAPFWKRVAWAVFGFVVQPFRCLI